jgi:gluconokinase
MSATDMGKFSNLEEASKSIAPTDTYNPEFNNHKTYLKYFDIFERLTTKLAPEFEDISSLQQKH